MSDSEIFTFQEERKFNQFIPDTFLFLKKHWKSYFFFILLYAGPFFAVGAYYNSLAQIKIQANQNPFSSIELIYSAAFEIIGRVFLSIISYGYIILYMQKQEINRSSIGLFFNQHFLLVLGATIFTYTLFISGLLLLIIPAIILIGPISLYVFDRIVKKEPFDISISRCFLLAKTDRKLSYGMPVLLMSMLLIINIILSLFVSKESSNFIFMNTLLSTCNNMFSGFTSITTVMVYFTLYNRTIQIQQ